MKSNEKISNGAAERKADAYDEGRRLPTPGGSLRVSGSEKSPSKRNLLKSILLAGGAASIVLAMPLSVSASSGDKPAKSSTTATASSNSPSSLRLSRVFRFNDPKTGAPQISDFQDTAPPGDTDLEVRMKHFTEIENFTFLGYVLSHELGSNRLRPIKTIQGLKVPDAEFQALVDKAQNDLLTDEALGDTLLDVGINWEHFVASNNTLLIPGDPLHITDKPMQAKIDSLDLITEALMAEVNSRSELELEEERR